MHTGEGRLMRRPYLLRFETAPIRDSDGCVILYDMFVYGEWVGSRRTIEQCELVFSRYR